MKNQKLIIIILLLFSPIAYLISQYNYLLYHFNIELWIVIIGIIIFIASIISKKYNENSIFNKLSYGLIVVSLVTLLHLLTYKGMNIIVGYDSNLPIQLWVILNYIQSLSIFIAIVLYSKKIKGWILLLSYSSIGAILTYLSFRNLYPISFIEGIGLTDFKIISEIIFIFIYTICIIILLKNKKIYIGFSYKNMIAALGLLIASSISFTLFNDLYGIENFIGHYLRLIGLTLIFIDLVINNIKSPYLEIERINKQLLKSETTFKAIFNNAALGICNGDKDGKILNPNKAFCKILGYSELEFKDLYFKDITHKDDIVLSDNYRGKLFQDETLNFEKRYIKKNGEIIYVKVTAALIKKPGATTYSVTTIEDITEEKRLKKKLFDSEQEYKSLFDHAGLGIGYFTNEGKVIWLNKIAAENMGGGPSDFKDKSFFDLFPKKDAEIYTQRLQKAISSPTAIEFTDSMHLPIGDVCFKNTYNCIYDNNKALLGVEIISQDISQIMLAKKNTAESEKKYRLLFEDAPIAFQSLDKNGNIIAVNNAWLNLTGYSRKDVIGKPFSNILIPEYAKIAKSRFSNFVKTGKINKLFTIHKKDQENIIVNINGTISHQENGEFLQTHCILKDITKEIEMEKNIFNSEARYRVIYDQAALGIFNTSTSGIILDANQRFCEILGYSLDELINIPFRKFVYSDDIPNSVKNFNKLLVGEKIFTEERYVKKNGSLVYANISASMVADINGHLLYSINTLDDITEIKTLEKMNKDMESKIQNQQKLESIGTLAGGVAHEINNPINGIMNYGQLILDSTDKSTKSYKYAEEIIHETNRVSTIVRNLLHFSRQNSDYHSTAKVDDIIDQTLSLINTIIKRDQITLVVAIDKDLPTIECNSQQIQQVIMNLLTNARDALNEKYEGYDENKKIIVSSSMITISDKEYLRIIVEDHGNGISKEIQNKIFDPFFTTKDRFKGTGLGLSISYGIIKEHGGELSYKTIIGESTKFIIDLPITT